MKSLFLPLFLAACLPASAADTLRIDQEHSAVVFSWNHLGFSNPVARFEQIAGTIRLDAGDITQSAVEVTLPLAGLHTGVALLDRRLLGNEFFDAARYPTATFKSTRIVRGPGDTLKIAGDLSLHGVTKPVVLDAKVNRNRIGSASEPPIAGFDAETVVRRTDYGVDRYAPSVSDDIHIRITVEASPPP